MDVYIKIREVGGIPYFLFLSPASVASMVSNAVWRVSRSALFCMRKLASVSLVCPIFWVVRVLVMSIGSLLGDGACGLLSGLILFWEDEELWE